MQYFWYNVKQVFTIKNIPKRSYTISGKLASPTRKLPYSNDPYLSKVLRIRASPLHYWIYTRGNPRTAARASTANIINTYEIEAHDLNENVFGMCFVRLSLYPAEKFSQTYWTKHFSRALILYWNYKKFPLTWLTSTWSILQFHRKCCNFHTLFLRWMKNI